MAKEIQVTDIEAEYTAIQPKFISLCAEVVRQLDFELSKENIQLAVPIQSRAKTIDSISEKIRSGRFNIKKTVVELQDLAGIRIITLFKRDATRVESIINSLFTVIKNYNTEDNLTESEFGYLSIHSICTLTKEWIKLPTFSNFNGLKFEIQVRTLSQHSWAEVSNIFQYKNEENVPKQLLRSINRISALLETVDLEFERLLSDRDQYKLQIKDNTTENLPINVDLLAEILDQTIDIKRKDGYEDYGQIVDALIKHGITETNQLYKFLRENLAKAEADDKRITNGLLKTKANKAGSFVFEKFLVYGNDFSKLKNNGFFFTQTGLMRFILSTKFGETFEPTQDLETEKDINV